MSDQHIFPEVEISTKDLQGFFGVPSTNKSITVRISKRKTSRISTTYVLKLIPTLTFQDINVTVLFYNPQLNIWSGDKFKVGAGDKVPDDDSFPLGRMLKPIVWDAEDTNRRAKHFGVEIQPYNLDNEENEAFRLYFGTFMWDRSTNTWRTIDPMQWQMFLEIYSAWNKEADHFGSLRF